MSTPTPDTPDPTETQGRPDEPVDAEASTSSGAVAPKKARKLRRPLIVVGVLIVALIGWIIYDQVRAPGRAPATPPSSSQPVSTTPATSNAAGDDAAIQTVLDFVTLSYDGKWTQACKLDADEATCLKVNSGDPAYPLERPVEVLKTEPYPAQGVAGQAYTGVLVSVVQKGATEPALLAYLVSGTNKIAGFEPVSSDKARLTLRQILERHIK